jgi:hypothetical protein
MTSKKFAESTDVPVSRTRAELEDLLSRYGATATAIFNSRDSAAVAFEMHDRKIVLKLALPDPEAEEFTHARQGYRGVQQRSADGARQAWEKACRRKWRALLLAVKAKLVAVDDGIETFEEAFMAHVVMPDGRTVADHIKPRIASAYRDQKMVPLLPYGGADGR